jgi:diguanylate cyclase (GGDEF)-like protein
VRLHLRRASADRREPGLQPPRLILRFAVLTGLGLAVAGACIFVLVRGFIVKQQDDSVMSRARFIAQVVLAKEVRPSDFGTLSHQRVAGLDAVFNRQVLVDGVTRATLYSRSGRVTYSTAHVLIGRRTADSAMARRVGGGVSLRSRLVERDVAGSKRRMLEEFVPIRFHTGSAAGTLVLWNDYAPVARAARNAFIPISLVLESLLVVLFVGLAPMLQRVTRQVRAHLRESEERALHDELTGLPNRSLFSERISLALTECSQEGAGAAVLLMDLDRFKEINDTLGHAAGDALLRELAGRLAEVVREPHTVARLGGDEFGVILTEVDADGASAIASRILDAAESPFQIDGLSLSVGASIGIAVYPRDGARVATLLKHADIAMYSAKRAGIGYAIYDHTADSHNADRLSLATDLRSATERGEIVVHYQPIVDLRTGEIEVMEALLRWDHPTRGLLTAAQFMPLAEQIGIVPRLSEHALVLALQQYKKWHASDNDLTMAVNLDMRSLGDVSLPERVAAFLAEYDVDPSRLELEITEMSLMGDPVRVGRVTSELAEIGVKLVVDDFAAGYTSLRYLAQLPISRLKIDRSLIAAMTDAPREQIIVAGIVDIAHNLGLDVVAEGIESEASLDLVRNLRSDLAQGYHLGKPVAAAALHRARARAGRAA